MARSLQSAIISCAVTGSIHTPSMSEHLPVTPDEIISEGVAAAEAGASIIHIHARDPESGAPQSDINLYREIAQGIRDECNAIVQPSTGGALDQSIEERFAIIPELQPEMASCNMGSMNFGVFPLLEAVDEFEFEWESEYLAASTGNIFPNTFESIEAALGIFQDAGTMPELECYDVGHLYNTKFFYDQGLLEPPIHIQFVMGILGGIGATEHDLVHMIETTERLFGDEASWSVIGAGKKQFQLGTQAISMGGNVRVGLEDNLYLGRGELAESNAQQVEKIVDLLWSVGGREPATVNEARDFLELKGQSNVGF